MRKSVIILLLIAAFPITTIFGAHVLVNHEHDTITITETVHYGDISEASGITFGIASRYDSLYWDMEYSFGEPATSNVIYTYDTSRRRKFHQAYLNIGAFEKLQESPEFENIEIKMVKEAFAGDDYEVFVFSDGRIALLCEETTGYEIKIISEMPAYPGSSNKMNFFSANQGVFNYDGTRLIFLTNQDPFYRSSDLYLAIYKEEGLVFLGEYENSLSNIPMRNIGGLSIDSMYVKFD